jgi:hypothetical protein
MPKLNASNANECQKTLILTLAADTRKFEIERFWARSLFFWGFIAAAFVAYAQDGIGKEPDIRYLIGCFGIVCSIAWTLLNRGSKYWQEAWEGKVHAVERDVLGVHLFSNLEPIQRKGIWGAARFSVSKLTIALSDFTVLTWLALTIKAAPKLTLWPSDWYLIAITAATVLFVALMLPFARVSRRG